MNINSWLPLLFIPTNASPLFILLFFISTYFLNRPCVYCSILLVVLFVSSCHWSDHCFFDLQHGNWFEPRRLSSPFPNPIAGNKFQGDESDSTSEGSFVVQALNETVGALAGAAVEGMKTKAAQITSDGMLRTEWTGLGIAWARDALGKREWRLPCVDVWIRL